MAGPKARDVLSAVSRLDWSKAAFPWLNVRECFIGYVPATVLGVSFSGELAYEIHIPNARLNNAYKTLRKAGEAFGMRMFRAKAVDSMRIEKGFLHWKADIGTELDPFETGVDRFVRMDKGEFVGTVTSGDWGYRIGKNLAYVFVKPEHSADGATFEVDVLGKRAPATIIPMGRTIRTTP